jgi:hypothetical protein
MLDRVIADPKVLAEHRKGKRTVAIVGFSKTSRAMAPYDDETVEIWTLNETAKVPEITRFTRHFQLHSRANFNRWNNPNDSNHSQWLKEPHEFPIYMQKVWPDIPASLRYPIENYIDTFGRYATSTPAYMMGLAILEGFERIELYGLDMAGSSEYQYQKAGMEYLIGFALGRGIEVYIPPQSPLMTGSLYGYQDMSIGYRTLLEKRKTNLTTSEQQKVEEFHQTVGQSTLLEEWAKAKRDYTCKEITTSYIAKFQEAQSLGNEVAQIRGRVSELDNTLSIYDMYPFEIEAADGDLEAALVEYERRQNEKEQPAQDTAA